MHIFTRRVGPRRLLATAAGAALVILGLSAGCSRAPVAVKVFEDVTESAGLGDTHGMTHGVAWGDFDGDGLPDLYVTNHLHDAQLFRNLGKGRFADITREYFEPQDLGGDKHGAAWADLDNDGRPDLVQLTGAIQGHGAEPKRLLLNTGARFKEVAQTLGVANPEGRTRMPLWLDLDGDGRLDLVQGAEARFDDRTPPFTFLQRGNRFEEAMQAIGFASRGVPFCIVTELTGDAHPELVCRVIGKNRTAQVFDTSLRPARELDLLPVTAFEDIAAGDFDNDGVVDLFLARKTAPGPVAFGRPKDTELIADVLIDPADALKPAGFSFRSPGQIDFKIASVKPGDAVTAQQVHIGNAGSHPAGVEFSLSPGMDTAAGITDHAPGREAGVYIGFTPPDRWQVLVTREAGAPDAPGGGKPQQIAVRLASTAPIADVEAVGEPLKAEAAPSRLFMNRGGKLVEEGDKRGVNRAAISGMNVVAGDFDNDMDLDLFILGSGDIGMQDNLLLLNRGDGNFDVVAAAGGANGSRSGVGDSVTTADFDGDGFLDLLLATGGSMGRSLGLPSDGGAYRLFRNVGNGNHWLALDLEGTTSNRDGIGARVTVTAGGVSQLRVQDGGIHHRGQNHSRLHFGLGKNTQAATIRIQWPSGTVQELTGVEANQVLRVKESAS